jgi:hypothetical protein
LIKVILKIVVMARFIVSPKMTVSYFRIGDALSHAELTMSHYKRLGAALVLSILLAASSDGIPQTVPARGGDPPSSAGGALYETKKLEGWTVLINKELIRQQPELVDQVLKQLEHQLYQIVRRVPVPAVRKLKTIRIWVEEKQPDNPCVIYRSDDQWLRDHGMNAEKFKCVEIANSRNFVEWTLRQPWLVLHELAHGYHHRFVTHRYKNPEIIAAFRRATGSKRYDSVLRYNGAREKSYALTDATEYFAESTEAFFGTNDFYPFVRPELKEHDKEMFALLGRLWGES